MVFIRLDRQSSTSLTRQLYEQLQLKIVSGELPSQYKLPSSRVLAEELRISRNLVTDVYETLQVEGYIESRSGSGTFVSPHAALHSYKSEREGESPESEETPETETSDDIRFEIGIPDALFPRSHWGKCLRDAAISSTAEILDYGHDNGIPPLQTSLKRWLAIHKGIQCRSGQILIFSGTHQALDLILRLFRGKVATEDPTLPSIKAKGMAPIAVDEQGPRVETIGRRAHPEALLVTPSHSYPLSRIMTIQRRIALIERARKESLFIVENDYDGELIYKGPVLSSIHLLAPEKVIHLGSFNGTMYPSLRLAYMVAPEDLLSPITSLKREMGFLCPNMEQLAMAGFMDGGYYDAHLIRLKKHFSRLYNHLSRVLQDSFEDRAEVLGIGAGQYLTARFPGVDFRGPLTEAIREAGLSLKYAYDCTEDPSSYADTLIFSFGKLDRPRIEEGVERLKEVLRGSGP